MRSPWDALKLRLVKDLPITKPRCASEWGMICMRPAVHKSLRVPIGSPCLLLKFYNYTGRTTTIFLLSASTKTAHFSTKKTYFLTSDFDCPPDGPIMLGHIITDPDMPLEALNPDDRITLPEGISYTTTKTGLTTTAKWDREIKAGLWAQILEGAIGSSIGFKNSKGSDENLAVNAMETNFIWPTPAATKKYIKDSLLLPGVKSYLKGSKYKEPVYMVVGLKIARKGASHTSETSKARGEKAALMLDGKLGGVAAEVGPQLSHKSNAKASNSFEDSDDFVFAYRLRKIVCSKNGTFKDDAFEKGALFDAEGTSGGDAGILFAVGKEDVTGEDLDGFGLIEILDEKSVGDE